MGIIEAPRMADTFGVPTYYITDIIREDAGNGNARIWNCEMRCGVLIPRVEIICHSARLVHLGRDVSAFALELYHRQQMIEMVQRGVSH